MLYLYYRLGALWNKIRKTKKIIPTCRPNSMHFCSVHLFAYITLKQRMYINKQYNNIMHYLKKINYALISIYY